MVSGLVTLSSLELNPFVKRPHPRRSQAAPPPRPRNKASRSRRRPLRRRRRRRLSRVFLHDELRAGVVRLRLGGRAEHGQLQVHHLDGPHLRVATGDSSL